MEKAQQTVASILAATKFENFDFDGHLGKEVDKLLRKEGFKTHKSSSYCKKASFESWLQKDGVRVEIIESNFMGDFTQIKAYVS